MRTRSKKRLSDNLCLRISPDTRKFLEGAAEQERVAIGEVARELLDESIRARTTRPEAGD